jgi:hypothetical protein
MNVLYKAWINSILSKKVHIKTTVFENLKPEVVE